MAPSLLLQFVNKDGNILLALSAESPVPSAISSLLLELDIHLPPDRVSITVDHFNYDTLSASEKHDVLLLPQPSALRKDLKNFFSADRLIAFPRAVVQELGSSSQLLTPIVRAPETAYSFNPKEVAETVEDPFAVGTQISVVSSMQARNSARFTILGSVELLENAWFDAKVKVPGGKEVRTSNREFAKYLSAWTFMETGVLKVGKVEHHLSKSGSRNNSVIRTGHLNPTIYRIKNDVVSPKDQHPLGRRGSSGSLGFCRHSTLSYQNTPSIISTLFSFRPKIPYNWNSPCYLLSIDSISNPSQKRRTVLSLVHLFAYRTSMASFLFESTTSGPF